MTTAHGSTSRSLQAPIVRGRDRRAHDDGAEHAAGRHRGPMSAAAAPDRPPPAGRVRGALLAIPGIRLVATYDRSWLAGDGLAAITVWALLVPQSLAYAQLGGFDPAVGLYASIGALIGYLLFGGAREMSVGPEATIAIMTATVIAPLAEGDPSRYLALGAGLALVSGILLVLAGLARLGFVTRYLSRPLLTGYVAGSAIVIIISQLDSLLGDHPRGDRGHDRRAGRDDPEDPRGGHPDPRHRPGDDRDRRHRAPAGPAPARVPHRGPVGHPAERRARPGGEGRRRRGDDHARPAAPRPALAGPRGPGGAGPAGGRDRPAHLCRQRRDRPGPRTSRALPRRSRTASSSGSAPPTSARR